MQEPEARLSQNPQEEIELLREKLRRLEAEHAEVQQKLFDQYEWTRQKTKAFDQELRGLRSISVEYQILDFFRRVYQRTTGLPGKTLEEEVEKTIEKIKVYLVAIPAKNDPNFHEWLDALLRQTHSNFHLTIVQGASDPEVRPDIADLPNVHIVRTKDEYSDGVRANIGLAYASGDVYGIVVSHFWPNEHTVDKIARFFVEFRDCQVMLPLDFSISHGLIFPTEDAGRVSFMEIWRDRSSQRGSFFLRPKAYQRLGRIIFEGGDSWVFATLFHLARHFTIGRPNSLIFVNASADGPESRTRREYSNLYMCRHFYFRAVFEDADRPDLALAFLDTSERVRYQKALTSTYLAGGSLDFLEPYLDPAHRFRDLHSPFVGGDRPDFLKLPKSLRYQQKIEQVIFRLREGIVQAQQRFNPKKTLLHFRVSRTDLAVGSTSKIDLGQVGRCPLTEQLPDRLLFSLLPIDGNGPVDVYYATASSVAIISPRGNESGAGTDGAPPAGLSSRSQTSADQRSDQPSNEVSTLVRTEEKWQFIRPVRLKRDVLFPRETKLHPQPDKPSGGDRLVDAYHTAIAALLQNQNTGHALWIGDSRFSPDSSAAEGYSRIRAWNEYPALWRADLESLQSSDILPDRNAAAGGGFDLIHLAGVLQFCSRPRHLLRFLALALNHEGSILISTPNLNSADLVLLGPAWCHWQPRRTHFIYGAKSLRALMRHCGFEEKEIVTFSHPLWWSESRQNVENALPPGPNSTGNELRPAAFESAKQAKVADWPPSLDGDFLIGLFSRKL
jgi:hypothetical protein